ncbi:hypothetical protein [Halanaerobium congolense]|uniref:hypothetical protein n=1 Tax=Halanaerobium congolense TaxID=54121 RepID=UPI001416FE8A|nr:hypothetical protein [Halanaerobium congolense]
MTKAISCSSVFAEEIKGYVDEKRSVGYKFEKGASILESVIYQINPLENDKYLA